MVHLCPVHRRLITPTFEDPSRFQEQSLPVLLSDLEKKDLLFQVNETVSYRIAYEARYIVNLQTMH